MNAIIVSGGWGYDNIGDDAILVATINILQKKFPLYKLYVLSYNAAETAQVLKDFSNIQIITSPHRKMFGDRLFRDSRQPFNGKGLLPFVKSAYEYRRLQKKRAELRQKEALLMLKNENKYYETYAEELEDFDNLCQEASLYVMSGGGYINENIEFLISKYLEVKKADEYKIPCYIMGQTLGPFTKETSIEITRHICSKIRNAFFRDADSINDVTSWGFDFNNTVVPDLALYDDFHIKKKKHYIVYIPVSYTDMAALDIVCKNLERIYREEGLPILILVSRIWPKEIKRASDVYTVLYNKGVDVKLHIPNDIWNLQNILGQASFTISESFHGLILSYRADTPLCSLNATRKSISFMNLIDASKFIINRNMENDNVLLSLYHQAEEQDNIHKDLKLLIDKAVDSLFQLY